MNPQEILAAFIANLAAKQSAAGPSDAFTNTHLESPDTVITDAEALALSHRIRHASPVVFGNVLKAIVPVIKGFFP